MFPIKMTQHRPSASAVYHGKHQVMSRQARSNSLRVKTDHQVPAWQCHKKLRSANRCAWSQAYEAEPLDLSLLDSCSSALARQAQRRTLETGAIRLSLNLCSSSTFWTFESTNWSPASLYSSLTPTEAAHACLPVWQPVLVRYVDGGLRFCKDSVRHFISYSDRRKSYFLSHYGKTMIFFALF